MLSSRRTVCALALASAACGLGPAAGLGAPPVISGEDGAAWNAPPAFEVRIGPESVEVEWEASNGESGVGRDGGPPVAGSFAVRFARPFPDGPARLTVTQRNRFPGPREETAVRTFVIDTVPPPPVVVAGPASASEGAAFPVSWSGGEQGAVHLWQAGPPGAPAVQGPVETTAAGATVAGLPAGVHEVRVSARDRAGNVGPPATHLVTVIPPVAPVVVPAAAPPPPPRPSGAAPRAPVTTPRPMGVRLPSRNAGRLLPRRAATLRTVRPVLRWTRGPKGTRLYNVQLFRVPTVRGTTAPARTVALRKVHSAFPRVTRLRAPRLARGACYVWRVWPYRAGSFTPRPVGVSHFCVARTPAARR
jgi:hypothetical protein